MAKAKQKNPLTEAQRKRIDILHRLQIILEIILVCLFFATVTVRFATTNPAYGILILFIILAGLLALFIVGILITVFGSNLKSFGAPIDTYSKRLSRWITIDWFFIPGFLLVSFLTMSVPALAVILQLIVVVGFFIALICTIVAIQCLWARFTNNRNAKFLRPALYGVFGVTILLLSIFGTYTTTEAIQYKQTTISDASLEIDQSETRQEGKNGEKQTIYNLVLGTPISTKEISATDEIVAKGTTRYQYMYCSDGSSRYFTSEQMQNAATGFTHRSPDYCAQNGQGTQTALANTPQPKTQTTYVPTYTAPRSTTTNCYSSFYGNSFSCYSY